MSMKSKDWKELRRGSVVVFDETERIVSHVIEVGYNTVFTFHDGTYAVIHEDDTLIDYKETGFYSAGKDRELKLKAR